MKLCNLGTIDLIWRWLSNVCHLAATCMQVTWFRVNIQLRKVYSGYNMNTKWRFTIHCKLHSYEIIRFGRIIVYVDFIFIWNSIPLIFPRLLFIPIEYKRISIKHAPLYNFNNKKCDDVLVCLRNATSFC